MAVKVVTDSTADLPPEVARELGVVVVPLKVNFGEEVYLDGVDLDADGFFQKLVESPFFPKTSQPSAGEFAEVYSSLAEETDEILSLHISAKLSGTYDSALMGRQALEKPCRIEVIDSLQASMGVGLIVIAAARAALGGASLEEVKEVANQAIPKTQLFGVLDTLEYLEKGGRIGKAQAFLGTLLKVKPLIACRDGETHPLERVRTFRKALDRMREMVGECKDIEEMAVLHSNTPEEAEAFAQSLSPLLPPERIYRSRFGPVMGAYVGPGALGVALRQRLP